MSEVGAGFCCQCTVPIEISDASFESSDAEKEFPLCASCAWERDRQDQEEYGQEMRDAADRHGSPDEAFAVGQIFGISNGGGDF